MSSLTAYKYTCLGNFFLSGILLALRIFSSKTVDNFEYFIKAGTTIDKHSFTIFKKLFQELFQNKKPNSNSGIIKILNN